jgi:uncharacterized protein (TIGR03437 family)
MKLTTWRSQLPVILTLILASAALLLSIGPARAEQGEPSRPDRSSGVLLTSDGAISTAQPQIPPENDLKISPESTYAGPRLVGPEDPIKVIVELEDEPAVEVFAREQERGTFFNGSALPQTVAATQAQMARIVRAQDILSEALTGPRFQARVLSRVDRVFNGMTVLVKAGMLEEIENLPGVKAVHEVRQLYKMLDKSVSFVRVPTVWAGSFTGLGIDIAVLDDGIDYTHSNFGGTGNYSSNNRTIIEAGSFPTAKIVGGYDFAGDSYDGSTTSTPAPDPDPLPCNDHGTEVAGGIGGFGVNGNGTTYTGAYNLNTPFAAFKIGPGVAPKSNLHALKIFGCRGTTSSDLAVLAMNRLVDPNGDGNFSDRADIANLSFGAPFLPAKSPELKAIENITRAGVIAVVPAGNNGDTYYSINSLGQSSNVISVAGTASNGVAFQRVQINSPLVIAGIYPGAFSDFGPALRGSTLTGNVVLALPNEGCTPLTNSAQMAGRIAVIPRGTCTFTTKVRNAQRAGAVAVIITNNTSPLQFFMGDDGTGDDITIPSYLLDQNISAPIVRELSSGVDVNVRIDPSSLDQLPGLADTLLPSSSRGGAIWRVSKPDLAAPGFNILSSYYGANNQAGFHNGTSLSAAHVSGTLALQLEKYPAGMPWDVQSNLVNTASNIYFGQNNGLPLRSPGDGGGGRLDVERSATVGALLNYKIDEKFYRTLGDFVLPAKDEIQPHKINIKNTTDTARSFDITYQPITNLAGLDLSIPAGSNVSVPARSSVDVTVNATYSPSLMKNTSDSTISATTNNNPRHRENEEAGYIVATPAGGGTPIRSPLMIVTRPGAEMKATPDSLNLMGETGSFNLSLTGQQVRTGDNFPTDYVSLVSPFLLHEISPKKRHHYGDGGDSYNMDGYLDLKYIGVRTYFPTSAGLPNAHILFGIATYGAWRTPNQVTFNVLIDTNRDGVAEFILFNTSLLNAQGAPSDVFVTRLLTVATGAVATQFFINSFPASQFHIPVFNTNVMFLPVLAGALGLNDANAAFDYQVKASFGARTYDQSTWRPYNAAQPGFNFGNNTIFFDLNNGTIPVSFVLAALLANRGEGILLLHHHNTKSLREQVLPANLGFEGDLDGDGRVTTADFQLFILLFNGSRGFIPLLGSQFQRTDSAPRTVFGNGQLTIADWVQVGRYLALLDILTRAGGPVTKSYPRAIEQITAEPQVTNGSSQTRTLRAVNTSFTQGQSNTLEIEINALGGENGFGFSLDFDPAILSFVSAELGADAMGATLAVDATDANEGDLGLSFVLPPGQSLAAGTRKIARMRFNLVAGTTAPSTQISFDDDPITREVANLNAEAVTTSYTNAQINLIRIAAHVSAASFTGTSVASESIVAAFGAALATRTEVASTVPLPTVLAGTTVRVRDSAGVERLASLFFVSAGQINYAIPMGAALGMSTITITSGDGAVSTATVTIERVAPGLFAANSTGQGVAAAQVVRVKADGTQITEQVAVFDSASGQFIAAPIDFGPPGEELFLVLFGTGIRGRSNLVGVQLTVGGTSLEALFAGDQGSFIGLDQINARLLRSLAGRGQVNVVLLVDGKPANTLQLRIR